MAVPVHDPSLPLVVSFGGGLNSGAMIYGFHLRNITPALIQFADTGGELPHTYEYVEYMSEITNLWWGVPITVVRKTYQGKVETLEANCLRKKMLPSLAYGRKACSIKFKVDPQRMSLFHWMRDRGIHRVQSAVGYDAGEAHRRLDIGEQEIRKNRFTQFWYPLVEWGLDRQGCLDLLKDAGMPLPGKSSCYFCPAMKRHEILALKENHPEYFARALAIESNAHIITPGRGLGGANRRWVDEDTKDEKRKALLEWVDKHDPAKIPCGCYDG